MINLEGRRNILKLKKRSKNLLQVLLPEFILWKQDEGLLLEVNITKDDYSIVNQAGKREFFRILESDKGYGRRKIENELNNFYSNKYELAYKFDCSNSPFRYANGGVLPVIRLDSVDYFCLFYRDIFPIGWNIANGGSDTLEELLDPQRVVFREFGEELIITDDVNKLFYVYEPNQEDTSYGLQEEAWDIWKKYFPERKFCDYKKLSIPLKWIEGPDSVCSTLGNKKLTTKGYFLNINPQDNGIEVDKIALISLKEKVSIFDGETSDGRLYGRLVGLFPVADMKKYFKNGKLTESKFKPPRFFFKGEERFSSINDVIKGEYFRSLGNIRTKQDRLYYAHEYKKFDLCPVTRTIIQRYFEWEAGERKQSSLVQTDDRKAYVRNAKTCQIFITFRSADTIIAEELHDYLTEQGYSVFCSSLDMSRLGESDYSRVIDDALESATCLIVIGTQKEHFDSGWVSYEWRSFMNEIRSGRKPKGKVFTFVGGLNVGELPFGLRSMESIQFTFSNPRDSFEKLYRFVAPALA